jgi:hypothetical protein
VKPDLDQWLPKPAIRIAHARESDASADRLWAAASSVKLADTRLLGRLVRWRIPGTKLATTFDELFRSPPFLVLHEEETLLISGLVGRIWTLRRDYPKLSEAEEFRSWSRPGTARVLFANWVTASDDSGRAVLASESRVASVGVQGRVGLAAVRPLISTFQNLVGSDGIEAAVRLAEGRTTPGAEKHTASQGAIAAEGGAPGRDEGSAKPS